MAYGHRKIPTVPAKGVILASLALATSACGTPDLWQGEEVLVEARQVTLERNVEGVSEDNRELKDRFNALERLYVDLARHARDQDGKIARLEAELANFEKDPETEAALRRVKSDLSGVRKEMKSLENRMFSVEMAERNAVFAPARTPAAATSTSPASKPEPSAQEQQAPTGVTQQDADVQTGNLGTPVSPQAVDTRTFYGVHLASYRSRDQVASGWSSLFRAFGPDLQGLTPLVYTQSQEGIGTFLRLIVGPVETESEAESLCETIRADGAEQYCRVSEYQGEPIE